MVLYIEHACPVAEQALKVLPIHPYRNQIGKRTPSGSLSGDWDNIIQCQVIEGMIKLNLDN